MPIETKTINGIKYYKWGKSGKWYRSKKKALEQAQAIFASGYKEKK